MAKAPKRWPGKPEVDPMDFVLLQTCGAVQRAEIHNLEAHCQEMEEHIEILNQRFGVTYWVLVNVLKNFDNKNAEAWKKLFNGILKTLARFVLARLGDTEDEPLRKQPRIENRREMPISPESESETSADTHIKDWRKSVAEAEKPEENVYIDVEMEDTAGEVRPEEFAEKALEVVQAMHDDVESVQEQDGERVPTVKGNTREIAEVDANAEAIAEKLPLVEGNTDIIAKETLNVEVIAERALSVVQIIESAIPPQVVLEVTPKVEETSAVEDPAGVLAGPGMMWVQMPAPDWVVKAEGALAIIQTPIQVPRNGPGDRLEDTIEIDDDDDEMVVDPPTAGKEGNSGEVNESEESPK
ncbi:hypothetical protein GGX14DRAFT_570488 [Mycena pura]|uniref:Uncharacterized protein n=1 Tax=Mycena pura TaxID=153505 RepID=A0AAD6VC06_9AGAR|nr:hypothetical protein GGX14DRAFT_570488 [Mycena pura]